MSFQKNRLRTSCIEAIETRTLTPVRNFLRGADSKRFSVHRSSLELLSGVDEDKFFELILFFFKNRPVPGILSSADFLMHTLATNYAIQHLLYRMTGDSKRYSKSAESLKRAGCLLCGVKMSKTFCQSCISVSTKRERWEWHVTLEMISISDKSSLRSFVSETLENGSGNGVPVDLILEKIPSVKCPISGYMASTDQGKIMAILRKRPEERSIYLVSLLGKINADSLSPQQLQTWLQAAPVFQRRDVFPGRLEAIQLCESYGVHTDQNLLSLARRSFPDWTKLSAELSEIDKHWLSLTLHNFSTQQLFRAWNSQNLFSFRRALNQEDFNLLKISEGCNPDFADLICREDMTIGDVKVLVSKSYLGFAKLLKHSRIMNPEEFLAWLAWTDYPDLKLKILKNPSTEIVVAHTEVLKERKNMISRVVSGGVRTGSTVNSDLSYYEPKGGGKVPLGYQQKSWGKRWWS